MVWLEMKNCPKCGLANDVMRKYCRRCGAPLIQAEEEAKPEPIDELEELITPPSSVSNDVPLVRPTERVILDEEAPLVRPSEVASEQKEMESTEPEPYSQIEEPPSSEVSDVEDVEENVPEISEMDHERGKEVVADILQRVQAAEDRQKAEMDAESTESDIEPPPPEPLEEEAPLSYDEPELEIKEEEPPVIEAPEMQEPSIVVERPSEPATLKPSIKDEIAGDAKIRSLESDIKAYNLELQQLHSEFDTLRTHLNEEVARYQNAAEVKRIRVESIERELDLAKKEYKDADKEYNNVENRRKKELSNAEKRIQEIEKKVKKAEESKEKRIQDIEKEFRKREEE